MGLEHNIFALHHPFHELEYQGFLGDVCRKEFLKPLWDALEWEYGEDHHFRFRPDAKRLWIDFDLDCYAVRWGDHTFPWPSHVFADEYSRTSAYWSTEGWSGTAFVKAVVAKASLLTIAREHRHCGGEDFANSILGMIDHAFFDDKLRASSINPDTSIQAR